MPLVFVEKQSNAMRLTAVSRAAFALGLTPGLTLADARARVPDLHVRDRDHAAEARLLARIVAGCVRYTPMTAPEPPDGLVLDVTGCTHVFGSAEDLRADLARRLAAAGVTARHAFGTTPEQARALARFGGSDVRRLPVEALEADPSITRALRLAGLKTIEALAVRPRRMLAARFGALAVRLGRVLGEEDRHIVPERAVPPIFAVRRFAEPIGRVEDALACLDELAREANEILRERHQGGRRFVARFFRSDGHIPMLGVETGQPTRDPALLMRLFHERVEMLADPIDPGFGFDMIRLDIVLAEPLAPVQGDHIAPGHAQEALAALVDRLTVRLGAARVCRAAPENSHVPECAVRAASPAQLPHWPAPVPEEPPLRPLTLFDPPQPVKGVVHELPDGPPMRFTWAGQSYAVASWEGPERIAAEWWRRRDRGGQTRDYYRVEDKEGHRFWLFRHGLHERGETADASGAWFIHGLFA